MRILIDYRPALRLRSGVGEYTHELAGALVALLGRTDELALFSSSWKDRLQPDVVPGATVVDRQIPVRWLNLAWHRFGWPPVELLAGPVDVAHAMHPIRLPARRAAQIVTIHDLYFLDHPESTAAEIRRDYPALAAANARRADSVIVVSEYTAGLVEERLEVPPERITICPPGAPAWAPRTQGGPHKHILFIGTLEPRKNVITLLRAYQRLCRSHPGTPPLVLAGRISPQSEPILAALAEPALAERARHVGYVSDAERQRLYRDAAMLVLPSLNEGFGLPALEAMTTGVPVVAANRGALPELVGDAGLLVEPEDVERMAEAMARLLSDANLARRCGETGVKRAARFTWEASATRLLHAYEAAIERRRSDR